MDNIIKIIELTTSPMEVVSLLGGRLKSSKNNSKYYTKCPHCSNTLLILDSGVVCVNSECSFRAGNVVDYIVAKKGCSWEAAVRILDTTLEGRVFKSVSQSLLYEAGFELKLRRQLFDFFLRQALQGYAQQMPVLKQVNNLKRNNIDPDLLQFSIFVLNGEQTRELEKILKQLLPDCPGLDYTTPIVLPYFRAHHRISKLVICPNFSSDPVIINLEPSRLSYFGLLQLHPKSSQVYLASSYADAAMHSTEFARLSPDKCCLHASLDATSTELDYVLQHASYISDKGEPEDLRNIAFIKKYINKLTVSNNKTIQDRQGVPAIDFIINSLIDTFQYEKESLKLLKVVNLDTTEQELLLNKLHNIRHFELASQIKQFYRTQPVYREDSYVLYETVNGYSLEKEGTQNEKRLITNFTLKLHHNLVFAETTDIYHAATLVFDNKEYDVLLKQEHLDKSQSLERALRLALLSNKNIAEQKLPTIHHKASSKYLIHYIREEVSKLNHVEGVPFLGWNYHRTTFYGPDFIIDKAGLRAGKKLFHPSILGLSNFSSDSHQIGSLCQKLPIVFIDIINQIVAYLIRGFFNLRCKPLAIYNSAEARKIYRELFKGLGQQNMLQLNSNQRGDESNPALKGFPFWGSGYTQGQISRSYLPAFLFTDSGQVYGEEHVYDAYTFDQARQTLRYVMTHVLEWIFATSAETFSQEHSVSRPIAYSMEGASVIMQACKLKAWPTSKSHYAALDEMLKNIPFESVRDMFVHDVNNHIIKISPEAYMQLDTSDIQLELSGLAKNINMTEDGLEVDSLSMMDILSTYYHNSPIVPQKFNSNLLRLDG